MTAQCNLTDSDYRAFRRHVLFRHWNIHWIVFGMLVLILGAAWFGRGPEESIADTIYLMVGGVFLFGCWVSIVWVVFLLIRRITGSGYRGTVGEPLFEISDERLTESNDNGMVEIRLCGIKRIDETAKHFFVFTTTGMGHVIPKRDLDTLDALRGLRQRVTKS